MGNESMNHFGPLVGAIDEGTSRARFLIFAAETSEVLTFDEAPIKYIYPQEGWVEQDPFQILDAVTKCLNQTVLNMKQLMIDLDDLVAIGITNQRETTVVWDSVTGKPLYNAIVWMDMRTTAIIDELLKKIRNRNKDYLKPICGLPISTYFSAVKLRWLLDNVPSVQEALAEKRLKFGTIDTWLIWNMTGGINGGVHITDVTNASRTMLMNLATLKWDPYLLSFFNIPSEILPTIRSCSEIYGYIYSGVLQGLPISGCLGNQQSALLGHMCYHHGDVKNTYGSGCFLLFNIGTSIMFSSHGLLTTVAYKWGNSPATYALEGSIATAGALVQWLQDNLEVLKTPEESETLIERVLVTDREQAVFVPAFSGLFAPYWRKDARGIICGINKDTKFEHVVRAALQAVCFQTRDILRCMEDDTGLSLTTILVDGAMTENEQMMQMQADICGITVVKPMMCEITALGAAIAAGSAEGIRKWDMKMSISPLDIFSPTITEEVRDLLYLQWKSAVDRSLGWDVPIKIKDEITDTTMHVMTASGIFAIGTLLLLILARYRSG